MKYNSCLPSEKLRPFIKYYVIAENEQESVYKVLPTSGLVMGFQYKGQLTSVKDNAKDQLSASGVTGISDSYKVFTNTAPTGSILVHFSETGFAHFTSHPVNELFNLSLSLDTLFDKHQIQAVEEKLSCAATDKQRLHIVNQFLLTQLKDKQQDQLIVEAVRLIFQHKGNIRIKDLNQKLFISQSPFEKRFRKVVGTTPKKFASIIRFNTVLDHLSGPTSLADICHENHFFDQAHFIRDFKQFTGDTPDHFKRRL
jgi:AraC-like DNA-binding protein